MEVGKREAVPAGGAYQTFVSHQAFPARGAKLGKQQGDKISQVAVLQFHFMNLAGIFIAAKFSPLLLLQAARMLHQYLSPGCGAGLW